jgi:hypothetical protein
MVKVKTGIASGAKQISLSFEIVKMRLNAGQFVWE